MGDPREVAARAAYVELNFALTPETSDDIDSMHGLAEKVTATVLAAVAADDGLVEVLTDALMQPTHAPMSTHDPRTGECCECPWPVYALPAPDVAAHLAAVVRAWFTGQEEA
jgi:hypothetical protein